MEAVTDAATMFISTSRASVIITMGLTTSGHHSVLIRRFDEPIQPTEMHIEGTAIDVANEVAEALTEHFGSLSQAVS